MIEIDEFSFRYREGNEKIVEDISLTIEDGTFVGITGAAGSGKSTLTYALNGIIPHCYPGDFYGVVRVMGHDTCETPLTDISRIVGSVCQDVDSQIVSTIVEDEVLFGLDEPACRSRRLRWADPFLLNRGARQLLALASVIVLETPVIVLDEPTTGLDYRECVKVMEVVERLHEAGTTVIMVCHDMEVVADYAQRVVVMTDGQVVDDGPTFEVLRRRDILQRASLVPPQIVDISMRLAQANLGAKAEAATRADDLDAMTEAVVAAVKGE